MQTYEVKKYDDRTEWFLDGKRHREDGPAIDYNDGSKLWCLNGELHREDGPAIDYNDGSKSWYLNGKKLSQEKFNEWKNSQVTQETHKELTINQIENLLGYKIKVIAE
jgi:hypothetical protein